MLARINLAPVRFRRACAPGGPIARVAWTTVGLYGRTIFQANAWLREGLRPSRGRGLYSTADGTGSAATPAVARHKAISEAIERWAHDEAYAGADSARFGFEVDPTSTGLAAFPGLVPTLARRAARAEAVERSCLMAWSAGLVRSRQRETAWPGIQAVEIESPLGGCCVILFRRHPQGFYAYGHACADTSAAADERALIEMGRNEQVLSRSFATRVGARLPQPVNLFERRCAYYATEEGHDRFRARIGVTPRVMWRPELLVDTEIVGEWTSYATVWRVLYRPPVERFLHEELDFFLW